MRVLVTGAKGFLGKNLLVLLGAEPTFETIEFNRGDSLSALRTSIVQCDAIVHLAGENRPANISDFYDVNCGLTAEICDAIRSSGRKIPLIFASSSQAVLDNPYGISKRAAEEVVVDLELATGSPVAIYRLPGVFGKWSRPNYNSVVSTFCYNIANDLPIQISDPSLEIRLNYVDDVVRHIKESLLELESGCSWPVVQPEFRITLGDLARQIAAFQQCRVDLLTEPVGAGLIRALYATYMSYLPKEKFSYVVPRHSDSRGVFVEMLKTKDSGQFSFFTAHPGITRGSHYHHTKTEKFLLVKGEARFRFRNVITDESFEICTNSDQSRIVESIPGWVHDITNVGSEELIVMLWANEIFDRQLPDTYSEKV